MLLQNVLLQHGMMHELITGISGNVTSMHHDAACRSLFSTIREVRPQHSMLQGSLFEHELASFRMIPHSGMHQMMQEQSICLRTIPCSVFQGSEFVYVFFWIVYHLIKPNFAGFF